jgi:hypothetical protein
MRKNFPFKKYMLFGSGENQPYGIYIYIYIQYVFLFEYWSKVSHLFVIHSPQFCEQPLGNWYVPSGRLGCNALGGAKLHGMKYGKTRCKWIYFKGYTTNHRWEYEME